MDEWIKLLCECDQMLMDEKLNFHGIKFIHEMMVAIRGIPLLGTLARIVMVFNNKPNVPLHIL
jgi:peroxiredoxin